MFWQKLQAATAVAVTLISQNRHFHMWRDMPIKYLSLKRDKSILAFQLQFGTYEAESEHFRWGKEKRHFNEWFSRQVDLLYFRYLADLCFLKPVFKGILNTLYSNLYRITWL